MELLLAALGQHLVDCDFSSEKVVSHVCASIQAVLHNSDPSQRVPALLMQQVLAMCVASQQLLQRTCRRASVWSTLLECFTLSPAMPRMLWPCTSCAQCHCCWRRCGSEFTLDLCHCCSRRQRVHFRRVLCAAGPCRATIRGLGAAE